MPMILTIALLSTIAVKVSSAVGVCGVLVCFFLVGWFFCELVMGLLTITVKSAQVC